MFPGGKRMRNNLYQGPSLVRGFRAAFGVPLSGKRVRNLVDDYMVYGDVVLIYFVVVVVVNCVLDSQKRLFLIFFLIFLIFSSGAAHSLTTSTFIELNIELKPVI